MIEFEDIPHIPKQTIEEQILNGYLRLCAIILDKKNKKKEDEVESK